jgi:hypothetical protein
MGKQHTVTHEIPDGKFCNQDGKICPFMIGEMHSMCFALPEEPDLWESEEAGEGDFVIKSEKCPNPLAKGTFSCHTRETFGQMLARVARESRDTRRTLREEYPTLIRKLTK